MEMYTGNYCQMFSHIKSKNVGATGGEGEQTMPVDCQTLVELVLSVHEYEIVIVTVFLIKLGGS